MYALVRWWVFLLGVIGLSACTGSGMVYAPVSDRSYQNADTQNYYTVKEGDSLYSIAWAFGLDYRDLAAANGVSKPYHMPQGKRLRVRALGGGRARAGGKRLRLERAAEVQPGQLRVERVESRNLNTPHPDLPPQGGKGPSSELHSESQQVASDDKQVAESVTTSASQRIPSPPATRKGENLKVEEEPVAASKTGWVWPTKGRVVSRFAASSISGNKGIDIAGNLGQLVRAAAAGKVVYSGSGVRGYGNLLIIKHNQNYLSAYAYNQRLLVKEGANVQAGDTIAEMGKAETGKVLLHFEIRYNGQPVDPLGFLR